MTPRFSVIVAAYNAESIVGHAIDSALAQTERNLEVIVVDDASNDGTAALVEGIARRESRVRLLRQAVNQGPSAARNLGLRHAEGEWIAILDADDAFQEQRLETLLRFAETHQADCVADNICLFNPQAGKVFGMMLAESVISEPRFISATEFVRENVPGRTKRNFGLIKPIIRRSFLGENHIAYDENVRLGEDFLFYFSILACHARFLLIPEGYYLYSQIPGSITDKRTLDDIRQFAAQTKALLQTEAVTRDKELGAALRWRAALEDREIAYQSIVMPLKQGSVATAAEMAIRNISIWPYVLRRLIASGTWRARKTGYLGTRQ